MDRVRLSTYKVKLKDKNKKTYVIIKASDYLSAMKIAEDKYSLCPIKATKQIQFQIIYKINIKNELSIFEELYILLSSGIDLLQAMDEIINNTKNNTLKPFLQEIYSNINKGYSLSESLPETYKQRREVIIQLLKVAEKSENIETALSEIIDYLNETKSGLQNIAKSLAYPFFLICLSMLAVFFISSYVLPQIEKIFISFNQEIPIYTKIMIDMSLFIKNYIYHILIITFFIYFIFLVMYKNIDSFKFFTHKALLKIPVIGNMIYISSMYKFMFTLKTLIKSNLPLVEALEISSKTVINLHLSLKIQNAIKLIHSGKDLGIAFKEVKLFKNSLIRLLILSKHGNLDKLLERISNEFKKSYKKELEYIHIFLEPIILILISSFILMLALSTFIPIWSISANVGL